MSRKLGLRFTNTDSKNRRKLVFAPVSVFSVFVPLWWISLPIVHHRDTEHTKDVQRLIQTTLPCATICFTSQPFSMFFKTNQIFAGRSASRRMK